MSKRDEQYLSILRKTVSLGRLLVQECNRDKVLAGKRLWTVAYLAKGISTANAVKYLIQDRCHLETKLLLRSLKDALIDVVFLNDGPFNESQIAELMHREIVEDRYDRLEWYANRKGLSVTQFASDNPSAQSLFLEGKSLRGKKISASRPHLGSVDTGTRWRNFNANEKLKHLPELARALKILGYPVRLLGNAHAHLRPAGILQFIERKDEELCVRVGTSFDKEMYSSSWVAFEATVLLLIMCDQVIDIMFLGPRLEKRAQHLLAELQRIPRIRKIKQFVI